MPGRRKRPTVPLSERKRARKACDPCRRNKLKCDGLVPCGRCSGAQRSCGYAGGETTAPKTSLGAKRSDSTSEAGQQDLSERLRVFESLFAKLHPEVPSDDMDALRKYDSSHPGPKPTAPPPSSSSTPRYSNDDDGDAELEGYGDDGDAIDPRRREVLGTTPMPTASVTVVNQGKTHFEGRSSSWTFFKSARQVVTPRDVHHRRDGGHENETTADGDPGEYYDETLLYDTPTIQCSLDLRTAVLAALPPREAVDFLVTTFFRSAQANQFYIHPEIFSRKLNALYTGTHEFDMQKACESRRSSEFICLMFMVFAIGSQFAEVEMPATVDSGGGVPVENSGAETPPPYLSEDHHAVHAAATAAAVDFSRLAVPKPSPSPGWRFYEISRRLLPDVVVASSMTSVQACVLQGIFLPSAAGRDAGYNLLGLALRMAVNMGLHRASGAGALHPHVRELRCRLWWSVYVAERIFSIEMGRPLAISDAEIDAPLPVEMPAWREEAGASSSSSGSPMRVDGLVAMIRLCRLLGRIVDGVYCRPARGEGTVISPRVFERLQQEIAQSRRDLPERLRARVPGRHGHHHGAAAPPRSVAHIFLAYEQASILLTRSCLNYAASMHLHRPRMLSDEALRFVRQQAQNCVASAVASIQMLFSLRSRSLLCRFSFHDSLYCTAAVYVLLLGEKLDWLSPGTTKEPLVQGILVLQDLAKGSEIAARALRYVLKSIQSDTQDAVVPPARFQSDEQARLERGRKAWRAWMDQTSSAPPAHGGGLPGSTVRSLHMSKSQVAMLTRYPMAAQLDSHAHDAATSPSSVDAYGHGSGMFDLPPFWVLEDSEPNLFSRNLTADPGLLGLYREGFGDVWKPSEV